MSSLQSAGSWWTKLPAPVFRSDPEHKIFGPGHNSFTVDEQGRDLLVYHGRDYEKILGDPLFDPNRHTRIQRLYFQADGTPDFGIPVGNGALPNRWSPLSRPGEFIRVTGERIIEWESSDPLTAQVSGSGYVTPKKAGPAIIYARSGGSTGAATLLAQAGYGVEAPVLGVSIGWSSVEFVVVREGEIVTVDEYYRWIFESEPEWEVYRE